jgi:hypothetical protein
MNKTAIALAAALCAATPLTATAQSMQPGLWEMTMKNDAMKKMPQLTPQQMEMMKQRGITLPDPGGKPMKVCISKQMTERDQPMDMHTQQTGCITKNFQKTAGGYSTDIVCDGPNMKGTGKATGTFSGKQAFSSVYDFQGTAHGHPVSNHVETTGKWLSADCGDVKPVSEMMPKK